MDTEFNLSAIVVDKPIIVSDVLEVRCVCVCVCGLSVYICAPILFLFVTLFIHSSTYLLFVLFPHFITR